VAERLPVVVNLHGGGFIAGNASQEPGQNLVSYSNGAIVYVSVQYRLGAYGFLPGSAIRKDGALNAGLLDQRLGLEWVQQNIEAFGGDPKQVTIWGGSAGGASVLYQLTWKGGEAHPPFRSAIPGKYTVL
jgi:carboxylesterase type B